jgi:zinc-binding alcohol dehydrogenase family protein
MKAIALTRRLPVTDPSCLVDMDLPPPVLRPRDVLIEVRAVSVNPVDAKVRAGSAPQPTSPQILGWDVAGVVRARGTEASHFNVGDEVYAAGDITRPGSNAELVAIDERIVAHKPRTLSFAAAAALPLTSLTAYEALFHRLRLPRGRDGRGRRLLIIGAAGGVGSMAVQLAKATTELTVIGTASRPESVAWVKELGADAVIDHRASLGSQLRDQGIENVDAVLCTADTDPYFAGLAEVIAPQGALCFIVPTKSPVDLAPFYAKSVAFHWELMFTRPMFATADLVAQREILKEVADLVDGGRLRTTLKQTHSPLSARTLRAAHAQIESAATLGKLVIEGWEDAPVNS